MFYNQLKTAVLLGSLSGLLLLLGSLIGGQQGIIFAFILALVMNAVSYFYSDKIVLHMYKAQPLDEDRYGYIYDMVSELAHRMKIPMPKLWLIPTDMANAFATGRNPGHASVAVTTGILKLLNEKELRGVLAHELSHVKNRDILVTTIAATLATAIGYGAHMAQYASLATHTSRRQNNSAGPITAFAIAIFMPLAAMLIQLALSRSREYFADETGALCCQDPLALASALEKLHNHISHANLDNSDVDKASTAPLFIMHPFAGNRWTTLFATHPPIDARIARLRTIYQKMF